MPGTVSRLVAAATSLAALLVLTGCAIGPQPVVTVLPSDGSATPTSAPVPSNSVVPASPTPVPTQLPDSAPDADGALDCAGAPVALDAGSGSLAISGDCPEVQINGSGLQIDATNADVAILTLAGERLVVGLGRGGQVTIRGNDSRVTAAEVSSLTVQGDRNRLVATGAVGAVLIRGNDNAVQGASVGPVSNEGDRNSVG